MTGERRVCWAVKRVHLNESFMDPITPIRFNWPWKTSGDVAVVGVGVEIAVVAVVVVGLIFLPAQAPHAVKNLIQGPITYGMEHLRVGAIACDR